jgi:hypothetical protein
MDQDKKKNSWGNGWIMSGGGLVFLALGALAWTWNRLPPEIPLLYSLPWGEQQLVSKVWFGVGLGGAAVVLGVCGWFSKILSKEDVRAGVLISRGGFILVVIYLLSFFQVLRLMI